MSKYDNPLDNVRIASPCSADWNEMVGDDRRRFCGACERNVYNLSAMTRNDAERLLYQAEGRLCARYYSRPDGTIITADCPVGLAAFKRSVNRVATAVFSMLVTVLAGVGFVSLVSSEEKRLDPTTGTVFVPITRDPQPLLGKIAPVNQNPPIMGEVEPSELPNRK